MPRNAFAFNSKLFASPRIGRRFAEYPPFHVARLQSRIATTLPRGAANRVLTSIPKYGVGPTRMGITVEKVEPHWNYLLALERDLDRISRFVEFDERNFECFSIEIARVLLAAGAECDVVAKQLCQAINKKSKAQNIEAYRDEIVPKYPRVTAFGVLLPRFGVTLEAPWEAWSRADGIPRWWTAYNKTKHHRHTEYHRANLQNALNAVGGLFVLVLYLYKRKAERGELLPPTQLLRPTGGYFGGSTFSNHEFGVNYVL